MPEQQIKRERLQENTGQIEAGIKKFFQPGRQKTSGAAMCAVPLMALLFDLDSVPAKQLSAGARREC